MTEFTFKTSAVVGSCRRLAKAAICVVSELIRDRDIIHELDLALTEAASNVARHAYGRDPGSLEIRMRAEPGSFVEFEVVDWGPGPDPGQVRFEPPDPRAEGGRGFFLMKKLSDEFETRRNGDENIVYMRKNIEESAWKT